MILLSSFLLLEDLKFMSTMSGEPFATMATPLIRWLLMLCASNWASPSL